MKSGVSLRCRSHHFCLNFDIYHFVKRMFYEVICYNNGRKELNLLKMAEKSQIQIKNDLVEKSNDLIAELPEFCKSFFNECRAENKTEKTITQYAYDLKMFFDFLSKTKFKDQDIYKMSVKEVLEPIDIDEINDFINSSGVSSNTKKRRCCTLKSTFKYYNKHGKISSGIGEMIELPKVPGKPINILEEDQIKRLFAAITSTEGLSKKELKNFDIISVRDKAIISLLAGTGIRVNELVMIDITNIDFNDARISVFRKGGAITNVYMSIEVEDAIRAYLAIRDRFMPEKDDKALFISTNRTRITARAVEQMVAKYGLKAGLSYKVTPHTLRRSFGTHLYRESNDIFLVAKALNQESVETTRKYYTKSDEEMLKTAASLMRKLIRDDK